MRRPAERADEVAEAVRHLNHATMRHHSKGGGWDSPSDAYDVLGGLQLAAMRMPQALQQVGKFVDGFADEGRLGVAHDWPCDVATSHASLTASLLEAISAAEALTKALAMAHAAAALLTVQDRG